tara:strand:+ start:184 stop:318 length:135 start_codon:yes stop_codon:yes gene_type:complete
MISSAVLTVAQLLNVAISIPFATTLIAMAEVLEAISHSRRARTV